LSARLNKYPNIQKISLKYPSCKQCKATVYKGLTKNIQNIPFFFHFSKKRIFKFLLEKGIFGIFKTNPFIHAVYSLIRPGYLRDIKGIFGYLPSKLPTLLYI